MAREAILHDNLVPEDEDRDLRPQRMSEMIGQRAVAERLGIAENTVRQYVYLAKLRTGTKTLGGLINWHAEHSAK